MSPEPRIDKSVSSVIKILQQDFIVVGKERVHPFVSWAVIAFFAGVTITLAFLVSRTGTFQQGQAAQNGLVLHWTFDESDGILISDTSGNGNNGSIFGAERVDGKMGKALQFDGAADYALATSLLMDQTRAFSVAYWVKSTDTRGTGADFSYATGGKKGADDEFLISHSPRSINLKRRIKSVSVPKIFLNDGDWHHVAAVWDGNNGDMKFYKDGMLLYQKMTPNKKGKLPKKGILPGTGISGGGALVLGQNQRDATGQSFAKKSGFEGTLDDLYVFQRVLSDSEVMGLFRDTGGQLAVEMPTMEPESGEYVDSVNVTLSTATPNATIYYTLDGTDPTTASIPYGGSITISVSSMLKARAFRTGYTDSDIAIANYTIISGVPKPTISAEGDSIVAIQNGWEYEGVVTVSIGVPPGTDVRYTLDGSKPTANSARYTGPFALGVLSKTLKAAAFDGASESALASAAFINTETGISSFYGEKFFGEKEIALILVNFSDVPASSKATAEDQVFRNPQSSLDAFYRTISLGNMWMDVDTYGWITLPVNARDIISTEGCGKLLTGSRVLQLRDMAAAMGYNSANYYKTYYYTPPMAGCSSEAGTPFYGDVPMDGILGIIHSSWHDGSGMGHADTLDCGERQYRDKGCNESDGQDPFDINGLVWKAWNYSTAEKDYIGWLPEERVYYVKNNGTFTITTASAREMPADGKVAIKIPLNQSIDNAFRRSGDFYYLEYRKPFGSDFGLAQYPAYASGVSLHSAHVGSGDSVNAVHSASPNYWQTMQDPTSGDGVFTNAALSDGKSFYDDTHNITITQVSHTPTTAMVNITFGPPPCMKYKPQFVIGTVNPVQKSVVPGGTAQFDVPLRNNDLAACASSAFILTATGLPAGAVLEQTPLAIQANQEGTQRLGVIIPNTTSEGTYTAQVWAQDASDNSRKSRFSYTLKIVVDKNTVPTPPDGAVGINKVFDAWTEHVTGMLPLRSFFSDTDGIAKVELLIDGVVVKAVDYPNLPPAQYTEFDLNSTTYTDGVHTVTARAYDATGAEGYNNNKLNILIYNSSIPMPNVLINPYGLLERVQDGVKQDFTVRVYNNGSAKSGNVKVRFFPSLPAPAFGTAPAPLTKTVNVNAGGYEDITFSYTPTGLGQKTGYFIVDDSDPGVVDEIDDSLTDNAALYKYDVVSQILPDLKPAVSFPDTVSVGGIVTAEVDIVLVSGSGSAAGQQVRVRFFPHASSPPTYATPSAIPDKFVTLDGDSLGGTTFTFTASAAGSKTAYVIIDSGDPGDIDEIDDSLLSNRVSRSYVVQ